MANELYSTEADRLHSAAIHFLRALRRTDTATEVSAAQLSALSVLVYGGPLTAGELAAIEQVSRPTMSLLLKKLEARGLIAREGDRDDRRVVRLSATQAGRALLEHGRVLRLERLTRRLEELSASERATLESAGVLLERLAREL